jgi:imidazolonepropionase-like amidohydrolase
MGTQNYVDLVAEKARREGLFVGARIITCGPCLTMTGGHGWMGGLEVDGCDEVRKAARKNIKQGVDLIKIMATGGVMTPGVEPGSPQLTEEEMRAGIEEAHKAGRKTASHAQGVTGIKNVIRAGIDSIEHGFYLDDEAIEMMLKRGVALVPTLVAPFHIIEGGLTAGIAAYAVEKATRCYQDHLESFKRAHKAGVKIAMGTDAGTPLNRHGANALEIVKMVEHGMSNIEALLAATKVAADVCDRADLLGTITIGKLADILVIEGNPLQDITILQQSEKIKLVIQEGKVAHCRD